MSLLATFLYFAAVISGYAVAMALLLCPWLAKGLRSRFQHLIARSRPRRAAPPTGTAYVGTQVDSHSPYRKQYPNVTEFKPDRSLSPHGARGASRAPKRHKAQDLPLLRRHGGAPLGSMDGRGSVLGNRAYRFRAGRRRQMSDRDGRLRLPGTVAAGMGYPPPQF